MKRRVILGSIVAVFLLAMLPATNAIQTHLIEKNFSTSCVSYDALKEMNEEELIIFLGNLVHDHPEISKEFKRYLDEIETTPIQSLTTQLFDMTFMKTQKDSAQNNGNQTFLEKMYWRIFNYRLFRLYLSTCLFLFFQSKITLWRTMTWGIRLFRWVKIGIILGIVNPGQQKPNTPTIIFEQDRTNRTLTVLSVKPQTILWVNIVEIGAGSCDPFPDGAVTVGDVLENCTGIIVLNYMPTDEILGVFEFD